MNSNLKGDVKVVGAGTEYVLRPSFGAMMGIEQRSKKSLLKIVEEFQAGHGTLADTIAILKEGTKAAGRIIMDSEIEALFDAEGVVNVQVQMANYFVAALFGGKVYEANSSPKAQAEGEQPKLTTTDSLG